MLPAVGRIYKKKHRVKENVLRKTIAAFICSRSVVDDVECDRRNSEQLLAHLQTTRKKWNRIKLINYAQVSTEIHCLCRIRQQNGSNAVTSHPRWWLCRRSIVRRRVDDDTRHSPSAYLVSPNSSHNTVITRIGRIATKEEKSREIIHRVDGTWRRIACAQSAHTASHSCAIPHCSNNDDIYYPKLNRHRTRRFATYRCLPFAQTFCPALRKYRKISRNGN